MGIAGANAVLNESCAIVLGGHKSPGVIVRLISELRRRNVFRMAVLYVVAAWLIMQVAEVVIGLAHLPDWTGPALLAVLAIGFPIALVFSWFYELTPEGLVPEKDVPEGASITPVTGRRTDFIVIAILAAGLILFAGDKWWPTGPMELSVAVMPFENMSADPGQEYLADGISEEILNLLAQIRPLKVIARTSSFSFKNKDVDIATIASQLNTRFILEGSVRRGRDTVRITAQLIDARDSTHVWSETYDRDLSAVDLLHVQSEIARSVTRKLHMTLTGADEERLARVPTENTEAYTAYLIGRQRLTDRKVTELEEAVEQFARAIDLDQNFAAAFAGLADACYLHYGYSGGFVHEKCPVSPDEETGDLDVEPLVRKALRIDDAIGEAWVSLGNILSRRATGMGGSPDAMPSMREAHAAFQNGLELNPSFSQGYHWYALSLPFVYLYADPPMGWLEAWKGRRWQSVIERGLEVDPLSLGLHHLLSIYPLWAQTNQEAFSHARRMIEIAPDSPRGYESLAELSWAVSGRLDEAVRWESKAATIDPRRPGIPRTIAMAYAILGDRDMTNVYLDRVRQLMPPEQGPVDDGTAFIESHALLLSDTDAFDRVRSLLEQTSDDADWERLALLAMIDIRSGHPKDAVDRYSENLPACFEPDADELLRCPFDVPRVLQLAGDDELARVIAETRLKTTKLWYDNYPARWAALDYARGLTLLGRNEEALEVLEALVDSHWRGESDNPRVILQFDIVFDLIREHPRFQALADRVEADLAQQLENVRAMERNGELPTLDELKALNRAARAN